jgi:hypothetical protein
MSKKITYSLLSTHLNNKSPLQIVYSTSSVFLPGKAGILSMKTQKIDIMEDYIVNLALVVQN